MSEPIETSKPRHGPMRFRQSNAPQLELDSARRTGEITKPAFRREAAVILQARAAHAAVAERRPVAS